MTLTPLSVARPVGRPRRVFVLGTDTEVGKTTVTCALLRQAIAGGVRAIPFKPAQSGAPGERSDTARLLEAAGLSVELEPQACPHRYDKPLAPGIAHDAKPFVAARETPPDPEPLLDAVRALRAWEADQQPQVTFVEGAGGFHVPMPGGTWQPEWITQLADSVIVVARTGLGTINHTLLTLDAAAQLGLPILGVYFSQTQDGPDISAYANPIVIRFARELTNLGILKFDDRDTDLWTPLSAALA